MSLEQYSRSLNSAELETINKWRANQTGTIRQHNRKLWTWVLSLLIFWGARGALADSAHYYWLFLLILPGAGLGMYLDHRKAVKSYHKRKDLVDSKWLPWIEKDLVTVISAAATAVVGIDDKLQPDTAWLLQVEPDKILCTRSSREEVTDSLEIVLLSGSDIVLSENWTGKALPLLSPKRTLKEGERVPLQCETLNGTLAEIDDLLKSSS